MRSAAHWIRVSIPLLATASINTTTRSCWLGAAATAASPGVVSCSRADSPVPTRLSTLLGRRTLLACHSSLAFSSQCRMTHHQRKTRWILPSSSASSRSTTSTFSTSRTHASNAVTNISDDANILAAPTQYTTHRHFTSSRTATPPSWITCSSFRELVSAIDTIVRPDDCVAELGSQLRDVSNAIIHKLEVHGGGTAGCAILVDVQRTIDPERCYRSTKAKQTRATRTVTPPLDHGENKSVEKTVAQFMEIEALDGWRQAFLDAAQNNNISYTVLVLDLNAIVGNDLEWTSLALGREFITLFPTCRTVLVKSVNLNQWATRLIHADRWIAGQVEGPFLRTTAPNHDHPELKVSDATSDSTTASNASQLKTRVHSPKIIATVGVEQYRQTIARAVQPGDAVLEVGCHLGTTTHLLQQAAAAEGGYAIGVDCGSKIIRGAQKRYPDMFFSVGNAWKTAELLRIQQQYWLWSNQRPHPQLTAVVPTTTTHPPQHPRLGFDVVYVDVGGLSGKDGLLEALSLISALMNALEPRCLVIKSLCVTRLSSTLRPFWQIHGKHQAEANAIK